MRHYLLIALLVSLSACNPDVTASSARNDESKPADRIALDTDGDAMGSSDPLPGERARIDIPDSEDRPTMHLQVVLDRLGFAPGVVDGKPGMSTRNAISGFQEASDLAVTGEASAETRQLLAK